MFLRKNRRIKDGKPHYYWSLVETIRTPKGPRQRVVSYLGDLNEAQQESYAACIGRLRSGVNSKQLDLFKGPLEEKPVMVRPEGLRVERVRDFGDAWVGLGLWKILELDKFFSNQVCVGKEEISWDQVICFLVVSRFCEAMSKLAISESYVDRSALSDLLGIDPLKINKDRLYRAMDALWPHKEALGEHLKRRYGQLFHLDYEILIYDITSTYFEGQSKGNPQAKRGYSRDKRPDCKQVTLALIVSKEGFPLYYEVFDGNRRDVTTVEEIVQSVEAIYGRANRVWAMDRGMVSEKNLEFLNKRGTHYIVGTPTLMLRLFKSSLLDDNNWEQVYPDVELKLVKCDEFPDETFVLCRSALKREKEKAILNRFIQNIEQGLEKLKTATLRSKRPLRDRDELQRKIGALLKSNSRAARFFIVEVQSLSEGKKTRLQLTWKRKTIKQDFAELSAGCYLLRTNIKQSKTMTSPEIWQAYINLTKVEEAFRITKQELGLRPVWHQHQNRVQAHIFICFLALALQKTLEQMMISKGLGRSTRKVLKEFRTIKSMDVILPTSQGDELRLRTISEPDPALKILLQHLNLKIPKRLLPPQNVVEKLNPDIYKYQLFSPVSSS